MRKPKTILQLMREYRPLQGTAKDDPPSRKMSRRYDFSGSKPSQVQGYRKVGDGPSTDDLPKILGSL